MEFRVVCSSDGGGTLTVEDNTMIKFKADSGNTWLCRINLVKNLKVSRSTSKLRMTINYLDSEEDIVLTFIDTDHRDRFSEALRKTKNKKVVEEAELPHTLKLSDQSAARAQILSADPKLGELHQDVVVTRSYITDDDFWSDPSRKSLFTPPPTAGPRSSHFTRELIAEKDATTETYRLNKQLILDIFTEYPVVEEMYREKVIGNKMKESEFWVHFLTSSYFSSREARGARRAENRNIFESLAQQQPKTDTSTSNSVLPSTSMVTALEQPSSKAEGYGSRKPTEWVGMASNMPGEDLPHQEVGTRFNKHSSKILNFLLPTNQTSSMAVLDELTQDTTHNVQQILKTTLPAVEVTKKRKLSRTEVQSRPPKGIPLTYKVSDNSNKKKAAATTREDKVTKWLLSKETALASELAPTSGDRRCARTRELLKHFWRNVSEERKDEVTRIHNILIQVLKEFDESVTSINDPTLLHHYNTLRRMIARALSVQKKSGWVDPQ
eukprot:TRINITY_DN20142_c0_g1_i1.p1 TRINITY_DN20142_c0_g1~~TRINITY_DN20142_c0_g1_i1.p1  ORF type:complete len:495 (+),score=94.31 TRINITY_DN20142_c0_g1_i1:56-1540(+)